MPQSIDNIRHDLVLANRILWNQGVVDAFGHVSRRSPLRPDRFLISRSLAPASVVHSDIVELDLEGRNVDPQAPGSYLERFIHSEIYRARPDVQAVVHSHSPDVLPFTVVKSVPLRCVCHTAGFIGQAAPIFEIRDVRGDASDMLVRDAALGAALATTLGNASVVLMRGHGSTTVGSSIPEAVYQAVYAQVNARVQYQAMQLGEVCYLSPGEAAMGSSYDVGVRRSWELWVSQVAPQVSGLLDSAEFPQRRP